MITRCGLNQLDQLGHPLGHHLRNSGTNPGLLQALFQLDRVTYSGSALGPEEAAWALQNGINLQVGGVLVITPWDSLTNLCRTSLGALKPALCWCRLVERARTRACLSPSKEPRMLSSPPSPTMNLPPPPTRDQLANCWSSWSCPTLVIVPMSRSGARTVTSTPVISSSKSNLEITFIGVEGMIGSSARAASVIPSKSPRLGAHH